MILILFVLPTDKDNWLNISDEEINYQKNVLTGFPESAELLTANTDKKKIAISKNNFISNETLNYLFEKHS